ncbi:hypothetical protein AwWohl_10150 [Gammaproteobacteria bacterium]|nr:hypothetical protein AwWohl_10150 [Gammaproteobacteria bacterium]
MAEDFEDEDALTEDAEETTDLADIKVPDKAKWRDIEKKREEKELKKLIKDSFDDF